MVVFIFAQLASILLLGIWIFWYVSNYIVIKAGEKISPKINFSRINIAALVVGIVLLVVISFGMSLIFRYLNKQIHMKKLYDNFIMNITHELKSPLASIKLFLDTMSIHDVSRKKQEEFISIMKDNANRLNGLINSILEISKMEEKNSIDNFEEVIFESEVKNMIIKAIDLFMLPDSSLQFFGSAPVECMLNKKTMMIVFNNLIDNAKKYSHDSLLIKVKFYANTKYAVIELNDNGIGIESSDQKQIFEKFVRLYYSNIPNVKGTGLGLYWIRQIIKNHNGRISVQSDGKNCGTTFKIEIPLSSNSKLKRKANGKNSYC